MAIPLILQGIPRLLPLLAGSMYSASETDPQAIEFLMKKITGDKDKKKEVTEAPTPDPEQDPQIPPSGIVEALDLIEQTKKKVFSKEKLKDVFDSLEDLYDTDYQGLGKPRDMVDTLVGDYGMTMPFYEYFEDQYHGGVGDLGDPTAAKTITEYGSDYEIYRDVLQKHFKDNLGDEFVGYRIMNKDAAEKFLKSKNISSAFFSFDPREARGFAFLAISDAFMDPVTMGPRDDLVLVEAPIKADSLIMRGKGSEREVIIDPRKSFNTKTDIRIYNPYTGELIRDAESGSLKNTSLLNVGGDDFPTIDLSKYKMDPEKVNLNDDQVEKLKGFNNPEFRNVTAQTITVTDKEGKGTENFPRFVYTSEEDTSNLRSGDWASMGDKYEGPKVKKIDLSKLNLDKITFEKEGIIYDEIIPSDAIKER